MIIAIAFIETYKHVLLIKVFLPLKLSIELEMEQMREKFTNQFDATEDNLIYTISPKYQMKLVSDISKAINMEYSTVSDTHY